MIESESSRAWPAYAAACWALIFAAFHVIWALGLHVGLNPEQARIAFSKRWFLVYDLTVAALCLFAVFIALALARPAGRRLPARLLALSAWVGTTLLVLRSGASIIQIAYLLATGRFDIAAVSIWEPWFYLGALLFGISTLRYSRLRRSSGTL